MGVSKLESAETDQKEHIISAAETLMINCHHLASDLLDLAQKESGIEPGYARTVSRQLSDWATQLASTVRTISQERERCCSTVTSCP